MRMGQQEKLFKLKDILLNKIIHFGNKNNIFIFLVTVFIFIRDWI